jgi:hypothetical protein
MPETFRVFLKAIVLTPIKLVGKDMLPSKKQEG